MHIMHRPPNSWVVFCYTLGMKKRPTVIIIFGFSGSGKSTLAKALGKHFGLRVVHPSSIIRALTLGRDPNKKVTKAGKGFWESKKGEKLFRDRLKMKTPVDLIANKILLAEIKKGNLVMDSWNMAWLAPRGIKIYLKTNVDVRVERIAKRAGVSKARARAIVVMKDSETRKLNKKHHGFDIAKDHDVFDYTITTDTLSARAVYKKAIELTER